MKKELSFLAEKQEKIVLVQNWLEILFFFFSGIVLILLIGMISGAVNDRLSDEYVVTKIIYLLMSFVLIISILYLVYDKLDSRLKDVQKQKNNILKEDS